MKKKVCDHCKGRLNGLNNYEMSLEDVTLCAHCYEGLQPFSVAKKYQTAEELEEDLKVVETHLHQAKYDPATIDKLHSYFELRKQSLGDSMDVAGVRTNLRRFIELVDAGKFQSEIKQHLVTSGFQFEGYEILEYRGIVTGEIVLGTGFFADFTAGWSDFLGIEATEYRLKLIEARQVALNRAIAESLFKGGNAMIGVDFDYVNFTNDKMGLIVNGTSVIIQKKQQ